MGSPFFMLQPALADLLKEIPRATQIMYPKDISFILLTMGIGPGARVIEAGTGSGALTAALAYSVGNQGKVYSYEIKESTQSTAKRNLQRLGLDPFVEFRVRDISAGFDEQGVDALFLDVPNPYDFVLQSRKALKSGGYFGSICPTTNQVIMLLNSLRQNDFAFSGCFARCLCGITKQSHHGSDPQTAWWPIQGTLFLEDRLTLMLRMLT